MEQGQYHFEVKITGLTCKVLGVQCHVALAARAGSWSYFREERRRRRLYHHFICGGE